ncbi:hypothetical protein [Streptomyces sp. NPDC059957]|uniref:hypothetical protein n=1 Tax=Streptomyces sp. NPDC059957 TaxID=3347016 RepID=UPI0036586A82
MVDQLRQVVDHALRGLFGGSAVLRDLMAVLQAVDRGGVGGRDVLMGVLLVEQFHERPVDAGPAGGQGPGGIGRVEPAQHGGHERRTGQDVQAGALQPGQERRGLAFGVLQAAEPLHGVGAQVALGEGQQLEASRLRAWCAEFPGGQGTGRDHEPVQLRLGRCGTGHHPQDGAARVRVGDLVETVDEHEPGRPGARLVAEELRRQLVEKPEALQSAGGRPGQCAGQRVLTGQGARVHDDRDGVPGRRVLPAVGRVGRVGRVGHQGAQQRGLASSRSGEEQADTPVRPEDLVGGHGGAGGAPARRGTAGPARTRIGRAVRGLATHQLMYVDTRERGQALLLAHAPPG